MKLYVSLVILLAAVLAVSWATPVEEVAVLDELAPAPAYGEDDLSGVNDQLASDDELSRQKRHHGYGGGYGYGGRGFGYGGYRGYGGGYGGYGGYGYGRSYGYRPSFGYGGFGGGYGGYGYGRGFYG